MQVFENRNITEHPASSLNLQNFNRFFSSSIHFKNLSDLELPEHAIAIVDPVLNLNLQCPTLLLESTDNNKSIEAVATITQFLQAHQANRSTVLIAIGGGSLLDVVGFTASIYMRGINWWSVPTTLLAMVDASIGGKTAINFQNTKNLIGSFHPPTNVFIDPLFLSTLPAHQYAEGMAEIIKIIWTSDQSGWDQNIFKQSDALIRHAIELKLSVINDDWFESKSPSCREILNAGHTFGHAFETMSPNLSHGQAVALGLIAEHELAEFLTQKSHSTHILTQKLNEYNLQTDYIRHLQPLDQLINCLIKDKKSQFGSIKIIVSATPGNAYSLTCSASDIRTFVSQKLS